jgi:hypothetical protein
MKIFILFFVYYYRFGLEIPRNYNPADFYIKQLAIYPKTREENLAQIKVEICFLSEFLFKKIIQFNSSVFVMDMKNLHNILVIWRK